MKDSSQASFSSLVASLFDVSTRPLIASGVVDPVSRNDGPVQTVSTVSVLMTRRPFIHHSVAELVDINCRLHHMRTRGA